LRSTHFCNSLDNNYKITTSTTNTADASIYDESSNKIVETGEYQKSGRMKERHIENSFKRATGILPKFVSLVTKLNLVLALNDPDDD